MKRADLGLRALFMRVCTVETAFSHPFMEIAFQPGLLFRVGLSGTQPR